MNINYELLTLLFGILLAFGIIVMFVLIITLILFIQERRERK